MNVKSMRGLAPPTRVESWLQRNSRPCRQLDLAIISSSVEWAQNLFSVKFVAHFETKWNFKVKQ